MIGDLAVYQIIIIVFVAIFILRGFIQLLRKRKSIREFLLLFALSLSFIIFTLFPNITNYIAALTGFELGINAISIFSILTLLYITLRLIIKTDKMENSITQLVRKEALEKITAERKN